MKVIINGQEVAVLKKHESEIRNKGDVYCYMLDCEKVETLNCLECPMGCVVSIGVEVLRKHNEFID